MPNPDGNIQEMARLFRVLGDRTRLAILIELQSGSANVGQLCRKLRAAQPTVSHHLALLRLGGLVSAQRRGKEVFYSLGDSGAAGAAQGVQKALKRASALRLGPLVVGIG